MPATVVAEAEESLARQFKSSSGGQGEKACPFLTWGPTVQPCVAFGTNRLNTLQRPKIEIRSDKSVGCCGLQIALVAFFNMLSLPG